MNPRLYLDRAALRFSHVLPHTPNLSDHTEINLQDVPNREYMLKLFVKNEEIELQRTGDRSWTPAERQYVF